MGKLISMAVAVACLVVCVAPVGAQERTFWKHGKGQFKNTKGKQWTEKVEDNGFHTYFFVETARSPQLITLFDKSRDCTVRLYSNHCDIKAPFTDNKFKKFYDGKWVGAGSIRVLQRVSIPGGALVWRTAVSPDGRYFAAGIEGVGVVVWDGKTGKEIRRNGGWLPEYTQDGKWLVNAEADTLRVFDTATGKALLPCRQSAGRKIWDFSLSPNSRHALAWSDDLTLLLSDLRTGKVLKKWSFVEAGYLNPIWTADGKFVLIKPAGAKHQLVWDVERNTPSDRFKPLLKFDRVAYFRPGHKQAVVIKGEKSILVDLPDGKVVATLPTLPTVGNVLSGGGAAGVPSVALLGYQDGKLRLFDTLTAKEHGVFRQPDGEKQRRAGTIILTPDGRRACVASDRSIYLLNLPALREKP